LDVYAVQKVISASAFFIFLSFFVSNVQARDCEDIWLIEGLQIKETNENPSLAKQNAEKKVSRLAFQKLVSKIVVNSSIVENDFLNSLNDDEINSLIDYRLIKDEKILANRYIGSFDFCFLNEKVTKLFFRNQVKWSELYSRPIIVFPVWKTNFVLRLWKDPNPIKSALDTKINNHKGLTKLIFPKNKIGVLRSIDARLAFDGDEKSIARAIKRSDASRALNLHFEVEKIKFDEIINFEDLNLSQVSRDRIFKMKVNAFLHDNSGKKQGLLYQKNSYFNIDMANKIIAKSLDDIVVSLEEKWKLANVFIGYNLNEVEIFISVENLKDWIKSIKTLKSLPGIKSVRTIKLKKNGAYVSLLVEGGVDRLVSIVLENKLPFSGSKKNLIFESSKL
tara:strand:- start:353 stop:1528 length:1176 start_codon:yes stop_codon:yes gene_type:complete